MIFFPLSVVFLPVCDPIFFDPLFEIDIKRVQDVSDSDFDNDWPGKVRVIF